VSRTAGSRGSKTIEAIEKAGLRLIFQHGYEAMNLRDLAFEVGIQVGSLYNHIASKQELLFKIMREHMENVLEALDKTLRGPTDCVVRMQTFVAFHVTYHTARKREVFVVTSELRSLEPQNYAVIIKYRREYEQRLIDILEEGVTRGVFHVADVRVASFAILAMLTGISTWYRSGGRLSKNEVIELYTKLIMGGLQNS
jgi:AcrR family transcriptional regulator